MLNIAWMMFVARILEMFGFDTMFITGLNQWTGIEITISGYYFIFAVIGIIKNIIEKLSYSKDINNLTEEIKDLLK